MKGGTNGVKSIREDLVPEMCTSEDKNFSSGKERG